MKLAIVGSRSFNNYEKVLDALSLFDEPHRLFNTLISGGAKGADSLGERWANYFNVPIERFIPDWKNEGKIAGFNRNTKVVEACDMVLAFWDGVSRGTKDTIEKAKRAKKPTLIIYV